MKYMTERIHGILRTLAAGIFFMPLYAHAAAWTCGGTANGSMYQNPITFMGIRCIPEFLLALVELAFRIGMPIIVLFIIYAGFLFVTAQDNESKLAKARTTFFWTVIGALVLLGAKAIALAIEGTVLSLGSIPGP